MSVDNFQYLYKSVDRQEFRRYYQPSRIVICLLECQSLGRYNAITLCFNMYCSYEPPMMAFAVQEGSYSYDLLQVVQECVLAIPGESMARETLYCGVNSGRSIDKVKDCGFTLIGSECIAVPGITEAIANVELRLIQKTHTGDHLTVFGEVLRFSVNEYNSEKCLLSIGPHTNGYKVIAHQDIHRIAVVHDS